MFSIRYYKPTKTLTEQLNINNIPKKSGNKLLKDRKKELSKNLFKKLRKKCLKLAYFLHLRQT